MTDTLLTQGVPDSTVQRTSLLRESAGHQDNLSPRQSGKTIRSSTGLAAWGTPYMGCYQNKPTSWAQVTPHGEVPAPNMTIWCPAKAGDNNKHQDSTGLWAPGLWSSTLDLNQSNGRKSKSGRINFDSTTSRGANALGPAMLGPTAVCPTHADDCSSGLAIRQDL